MDYENWYITNLIGSGAFAKVYLVKHKEKDENGELQIKHYAMKCIHKFKVANHKFVESTMKERQLLLELDHPFILKLRYAF
jgi:serine/threonine protein kinase